MKKLLLLLVLLLSSHAFCQQDAWVYFSGKQNASFYLENPLEMLSQRALDRRTAQNIALDIQDVPITESYVDQVEAALGVSVLAKSKWLNAVHVRGSQASINALLNLSFVSSIDFADDSLDANPNRNAGQRRDANEQIQPNSHNKQLDVAVAFNYGNSANQIEMLNGQVLHQQDYTGQGKIIAVLDAGFPSVDSAQPFQRLWDNGLILGGHNFVDGNDNIFARNNHGTMVLSTMGGYTDGELVGTAPDASYYLFITEAIEYENPVEESYWAEAAEQADSLGVDVITTSLGYSNFDNSAYNYSYQDRNGSKAFITRAADIAFTRGIVVVASAGNDGQDEENHISVPADGMHVLAIGAVTANENYAAFSSIGPSSDGRVKPDVVAQGQSAVVSNTNGNIVTASGTSFSGPIIAGMAAAFWSAVPSLTNQQVVDFIRQSADMFANPNALKGYGVPDFGLALDNALLSVQQHSATRFGLWPNPVLNTINLKLPQSETSGTLEIYDTNGRLVKTSAFEGDQASVDCSELSPGIYIFSLVTPNAKRTGKFIKSQ